MLKTYGEAGGDFDIREVNFQSEALIKNTISNRDANVQTILNTVTTGSVVDQIKALNDWLTKNNEYNTNLSAAQNGGYPAAWECTSALAGSEGTEGPVCEGYARAFKVLCDRLSIPCVLVDGHATSTKNGTGEAHMWNYVQVDGAWYAVDVTWDDPVVQGRSGKISGYESETWLLLGSDSVVESSTGFKFIDSHPIANRSSIGGIQFINGPVLSVEKYTEKNPAEVLFTSSEQSAGYTGNVPTISGLSVKAGGVSVTNPVVTYSYRVKGSTGAFIAGLPVNAGEYEVKAHVAAGADYGAADSSNTLLLTITKALVTVAIADTYTGKVYDGTVLAVPSREQVTVNGAQYENISFEWYKDSQKLSVAPTNAGSYTIKAVVGETNNYSAGSVEKTIMITQRSLTITAKGQTIALGEQISTGISQVDCSNLVTGHTLGSIVLTANTAVATENGTITPSAAIVKNSAGTDVTSNYNITYTAGKLVVTKPDLSKAELTLDVNSYTYDGTSKEPVVTVKLNSIILNKGTDYTVSYENNINAGTAKVKITASSNGNYIGEAVKEFTINKKPVTVTVSAQDKTYDGSTDANVTGTIEGRVNNDDITVELTGTFADKNAGSGKKVVVSGTVSGTSSGNYQVTIPTETTATINKKPITVTANNVSKTYGAADPELTWTSPGLVSGDSLTGSLSRAAGEDVKDGGYAITQGTLTAGSNYNITFRAGVFTINPATYTSSVVSTQNILEGLGAFIEPEFKGVKNEVVTGTITYSYGSNQNQSYEDMKGILTTLALDTTGEITYSFTANNSNYNNTAVTGKISFTVKDVLFEAGGETATENNAVTIKSSPVYGDNWTDIVKIGSIKAVAGNEQDSDASHFTLKETGIPNAGEQEFIIVYNGTLNGKTYTDTTVCTGKVNIAKRLLTVTSGSSKVSKTYDGTTTAGVLSSAVNVTGILSKDTGITVRVVPAAYTSPDVGGQTNVQAALTIEGDIDGNYQLAGTSVMIPCEILPKAITPSAAFTETGIYTYTGEPITPGIEVKDGNDLLKSSDYTLTWSDHIHAGTAKVVISSKAGGNYTWTTPIELTFTIEKAVYTGTKSANISTRYGREGTFDLTSFLPEGYQLGALQVEDDDQIFETAPVINGGAVSYTLVSDQTLKGKQAVVTIPITDARDYEPFEFQLTVTLSDKAEQSGFGFDAEKLDKIYGDEDFLVSVKNAAPDSRITYTISDPAVASIDESGKVHILKVGTTVIMAEASETEEYMSAVASCTLTVVPKVLVWDVSDLSAVDKEGTISDRKASLYGELRVSGILKGDDAVFICPASWLTGTYSALTPGEQKVVLAWAGDPVTLQGTKSGNYTMPQVLPELIGKINAVRNDLLTPPESSKEVQFQLELEKGISSVPEAFKGMENLNTPAKIDTQMRLNLQKVSSHIEEANIEVYDVILMVNIADGGWQKASKENFPSTGLTITLPYPEGTGRKTHDFMVSHLFTEDINGHRAGEIEYPSVTKTADGIRFKVYGLSPISVGWAEAGVLHNPQSGGSGNSSSSSGSSTTAASQQSAVESAATADESPIAFYTGMLFLSIAGLACICTGRRRRKMR